MGNGEKDQPAEREVSPEIEIVGVDHSFRVLQFLGVLVRLKIAKILFKNLRAFLICIVI